MCLIRHSQARFNMIKVAVIGSNSFSGAHFIDLLLNSGQNEVIGISRSAEKEPLFLPYKRHKNPSFAFYRADLNRNLRKVSRILEKFKPDYIVNFAGLIEVSSSWQYPEQYFQTNTVAIVALINSLKNAFYLKRYVHISTPEVYGSCRNVLENASYNPSTPYAVSKAATDMYLLALIRQTNFPAILIRSTNVYGPGQQLFRIIPKTIISLKQGSKIPLEGGGKAIKSYLNIKDVCRGIFLAMEKGKNGKIYHFSPEAGGKKVKQIVEVICLLMGYDFRKATRTVKERPGQDKIYVINSNLARKTLNWQPSIRLEDGIKEVIDWVEINWNKIQNMTLRYQHKF